MSTTRARLSAPLWSSTILLAMIGGASAQSLPKEGRYDYIACGTEVRNVIEFSKTHRSTSYETLGTVVTIPPGGMFDKNTFRCVGWNASFDGKVTGRTVCETVDKEGNKRLTYFLGDEGKVTRQTLAGTGIYDGMEVTNTFENLGPFPEIKPGTVQNCNHQTGTYNLK